MKKWITAALCLVLLAGCKPQSRQFSVTWLELFDTVTTVSGFAENQDAFHAQTAEIYTQLQKYHRLFDIYKEYDGVNNLKTVNDAAGLQPVQVDSAVIALLKDCIRYHELTEGRVNIAMGSVLALWHEARETGILPTNAALQNAAEHTDIKNIIIDEENSTVYLADPLMRLNVGAVAKGWAAQKAAEAAPEGCLLSVGGNVCATGAKATGEAWTVGIQNPDGGDPYLHILAITGGSVVTSGDYQRHVEVEGKKYHHIIDPDTLHPSEYWRSVTVVCEDSALADALSTALFLLPLEEGKALLKKSAAEAMWLAPDGTRCYSDGFEYLS